MATFKISGIKGIDKALTELPNRVAKKVIRKAMRSALKPVQSRVKALAPVGETGQLKQAVKVRASKRKKKLIFLNVRIGKQDFTGDTYYGAMVEFGHKIRSGGQVVGQVEGQHFMQKAFDQTAPQARDEATKAIKEGIEQEAKALARR